MSTPEITEAQVRKVLKRYEKYAHLTLTKAAVKMGLSHRQLSRYLGELARKYGFDAPPSLNKLTISTRLQRMPKEQKKGLQHEYGELAASDLPVEEIIQQRIKEYSVKSKYEASRKLIPIRIKTRGPIGIIHAGDSHLDDDGTDIGAAFYHAELTKQVDGLWIASVGDLTNNWVGRLARLYANQNMGKSRAIKVMEHYIKSGNWLYIVGGNHDLWSGDDDPIKWIANSCNALYQASEVRVELRFPEGQPFRINCRHDFSGHSMWNPAHALLKAFTMGVRDNLYVAGHRHESGYSMMKDPATGLIGHLVRVASYKKYDAYARDKGFRDQSFGPAVVTVIDPLLPEDHPDRCKVFWDVDEGVAFLKYKRSKVA